MTARAVDARVAWLAREPGPGLGVYAAAAWRQWAAEGETAGYAAPAPGVVVKVMDGNDRWHAPAGTPGGHGGEFASAGGAVGAFIRDTFGEKGLIRDSRRPTLSDPFNHLTLSSSGDIVVSSDNVDLRDLTYQSTGRELHHVTDADGAREVADMLRQMDSDATNYPYEPDDDENYSEYDLIDSMVTDDKQVVVGRSSDNMVVVGWAKDGVEEPDPAELERDYSVWWLDSSDVNDWAYELEDIADLAESDAKGQADFVDTAQLAENPDGTLLQLDRYEDHDLVFSRTDAEGENGEHLLQVNYATLINIREYLGALNEAGLPDGHQVWYLSWDVTVHPDKSVTLKSRHGHGEVTFPPDSIDEVLDGIDLQLRDTRRDGFDAWVQDQETMRARVEARTAEAIARNLERWEAAQAQRAADGKASTADLVKVGPKGYEHGWIYVGPPRVGDIVHHPEHGSGRVTRRSARTVGVQFESGGYQAFEHGVETPDREEHFTARPAGMGAGKVPRPKIGPNYIKPAKERRADALEMARRWSGNPYLRLSPIERLTAADLKAFSDDDRRRIVESLERLKARAEDRGEMILPQVQAQLDRFAGNAKTLPAKRALSGRRVAEQKTAESAVDTDAVSKAAAEAGETPQEILANLENELSAHPVRPLPHVLQDRIRKPMDQLSRGEITVDEAIASIDRIDHPEWRPSVDRTIAALRGLVASDAYRQRTALSRKYAARLDALTDERGAKVLRDYLGRWESGGTVKKHLADIMRQYGDHTSDPDTAALARDLAAEFERPELPEQMTARSKWSGRRDRDVNRLSPSTEASFRTHATMPSATPVRPPAERSPDLDRQIADAEARVRTTQQRLARAQAAFDAAGRDPKAEALGEHFPLGTGGSGGGRRGSTDAQLRRYVEARKARDAAQSQHVRAEARLKELTARRDAAGKHGRDTVSAGDAVKVDGKWWRVQKANAKTVQVDAGPGFDVKYRWERVTDHRPAKNAAPEPGPAKAPKKAPAAGKPPTDNGSQVPSDQDILTAARAELARLEDTRGLTPQQTGDWTVLANRERARIAGAQARLLAAQPRPDDPMEYGNWIVAHGDAGRALAAALAQLDEITHNEASARAVEHTMQASGRALRPEVVAELTQAGLTRDPAQVGAAIDRIAAAHGLTRLGVAAGGVEPLDREKHDMLPGLPAPPPGTYVRVIRPGYAAEVDGKRYVLTRSVVDEATAEEIAEARPAPTAGVPDLRTTAENRILRLDRPGAPAHIRAAAEDIRTRRADHTTRTAVAEQIGQLADLIRDGFDPHDRDTAPKLDRLALGIEHGSLPDADARDHLAALAEEYPRSVTGDDLRMWSNTLGQLAQRGTAGPVAAAPNEPPPANPVPARPLTPGALDAGTWLGGQAQGFRSGSLPHIVLATLRDDLLAGRTTPDQAAQRLQDDRDITLRGIGDQLAHTLTARRALAHDRGEAPSPDEPTTRVGRGRMNRTDLEAAARTAQGTLNLSDQARARQLLKEQPVAVLREIARIHGIVAMIGGREAVRTMKKPDLIAAMIPWFGGGR